MTDTEILKNYIEAYNTISPDHAVAVLSPDCKLVYISHKFTELLNLSHETLINQQWDNLTSLNPDVKMFLKKIIQKLSSDKKRVSARLIYRAPNNPYADYLEIHHSYLSIANHKSNMILIELQRVPMTFQAKKFGEILDRFINKKTPAFLSKDLFKKSTPPNLTVREEEVLFLLTLGYGYKKIATTLSATNGKQISFTSISPIIRKQLFTKFDVDSVDQLLTIVLETNYFKQVPSSLIDAIETGYCTTIAEDINFGI